MIINYDKNEGFSSLFSDITNSGTRDFVEYLSKLKDSDSFDVTNLDDVASKFKDVDQSVLNAAKSVQTGAATWKDYDAAVAAASSSSSVFTTISNKVQSGVKSLGSVAKSVGGTLLSTMGNFAIGMAAGAAVSLIAEGIGYLVTYKQRMADAAKETTSAWSESNATLSEQIAKYKELKTQLDSGTLSPDEEYSVRQQILDIQSEITSQYGAQADGISLVNGNLEQQLAILQNISAENAKTTLNTSRDQYENVMNEMTKTREYALKGIVSNSTNGTTADEAILDIAKQFQAAGLNIEDAGNGSGVYSITFEGDATQANETISAFMNRVSDLSEEYQNDDIATKMINASVDAASEALSKNQEILDNYQESYLSFLQMDMLSQGTKEGSISDTYNKYAEAVQKYNEALASGDSTKIIEARSEFQALDDQVKTLLDEGNNNRFEVLFDDISDGLDNASIKLNDFNEAIKGDAGDSNSFKNRADDIKEASDALRDLKLDAQDVRDALITDGTQTGEEQILSLAKAWGLTKDSIESQDEAFTEFLNVLQQAELITGDIASANDRATESYNAFSSAVSSATKNIASLQDILTESSSGSGISSENLQAFRDMFGADAERALEKTANGYHINAQALRELQAQQESLTKSDYLSALSDQYELLYENTEKLTKAQFMGEDTSGLEATRQGILDQISSLQDLQLQYTAATSAYQDWINAQNNGNERDMYDNIQSGYAKVTDLIERGWGGSDEVRTYVDLLSSADLSTASAEEVIDAYNRLGQTIGNSGYSILDFFTVDEDGNTTTDGIYNFFDTVNSVLGEEFAKINENGDYEFNFGEGGDLENVANALNMDVEAVQAILRAAEEAGFEVNLDQPIASFEELKSSAQSAQEALANMEDTSLSGINLDSTSMDEITDNISRVEDYIEQLNNDETIEADVKTEKIENATAILEYLVELQNEAGANDIEISVNAEELKQQISDAKDALDAFKNEDGQVDLSIAGAQEAVDSLQTLLAQKEQLSAPAIMDVDTSQVDGELGDAIAKIQEYQTAVQNLNVQTELKAQGVDIDTSAAQEKVNSLVAEIQGIDPDITAKLNIDTTSAASIQSSLQALTPEILVKAGVDESAITAFTSEEKQAKGKVVWDNETSLVNLYSATEKRASGVVNWTNNTQNVKTSFSATGTISWSSSGDGPRVNGTANASGNWGIKQGGASLVGELGQEILVRGSKFYTIGDNGAEFIQTRPGDIIFNHKQSEALLKDGYITSRGRMIGGNANVEGSAYSSGSGGLGRPSRPSYSMDNSSSSSGSSSSSNNSSSSSSNNSSSSAQEAAEEFEEAVDWIEIAIDRLERAIDTLDLKASSTYRSWSERNQNLASEISEVSKEINIQQQGYNRYLQQANSVGLSSDWAAKVQNGTIDISTITNEDLADKIKDYQSWLISGHVIYFIAGTSPKPCFATT